LILLGGFLSEIKDSNLIIIIKQNDLTVFSGEAKDILKDEKFNKYWGDPIEKLEGDSHYWIISIGYDN